MITTASKQIQTGDTTVIASIYGFVGRHISLDTRKKMLEKLVINGVSYGWLAHYDDMIDKWLTKGIEIKGGVLPSDKNIIDIVNIIRNKVLPITNGWWYFSRALRRGTGIGLTNAYTKPDDYWYTSEGQTETAKGAKETLADDTTIAKIVVGLLSAAESYNSVFSVINIKTMLIKLINNFKVDISNSVNIEKMKIPGKPGKLGLILEEEEYPQSTIVKSKSNSKRSKSSKSSKSSESSESSESFETRDTDITMQILELNKSIKKCEKYLVDYTKTSKIRNSLKTSMRSHSGRVKSSQKSPESMRELRTFTSFGLGGGRETRMTRRDSKSKISSHNRIRKVVRRDRHRTRKR